MFNDIRRLVSSNEAIDFQYSQEFPKKLIKLYDQIFDWLKEYDERFGEPTTVKESSKKILIAHKWVNDEIKPRLTKLIKAYTNLDVDVLIPKPVDINSVTTIAILITDSRAEDMSSPIASYSKSRGDTNIERYIMISESISKDGLVRTMSKQFKYTMFLPLGIFMVSSLYSVSEDFTSAELAAITLHEIGHAITFIEYSGYTRYMGYVGNSILSDITTDIKEYPEESRKQIEKVIKKIKKSDRYKNETVKNMVKYVESNIEKTFDYNEKGTVVEHYAFFIFNLITAITTFMSVLYMLPNITQLASTNALVAEIMYSVGSTDDTARGTKRKNTLMERLADEYVSRHLLSKELNTGLIKLTNLIYKHSGTPFIMLNKQMRTSKMTKLFIHITSSPLMLLTTLLTENVPDTTYEKLSVRLARNIQNLKVALKDKNIPKDIRNKILDDIDDMEKKLKDNRISRVCKLAGIFIRLTRDVVSSPFTLPLGNLNSTYGKFFDDIDELMANNIYKRTSELKRLIDI
jgi:hypothetical protein